MCNNVTGALHVCRQLEQLRSNFRHIIIGIDQCWVERGSMDMHGNLPAASIHPQQGESNPRSFDVESVSFRGILV